ncbi:MAG: twin-arginine translocase TatA/TatE family subunit [Ardenticatenaceae bacterium]|nr:twin-arginine translocase TatA/TatE family subunit [Ardenticatenaceae bacterium]MCB9443091.1 twin-arginine translocase TatA/TatE family subunit [Ardenticatenaceae bacterium]
MDSFFGIGAPELILILLLAGIVMGPERIGKVARWLGKTTAQLQSISRQFMRQLNAELTAVDQGEELKGAMNDIKALQNQVKQLRDEIKSSAMKPLQEGQAAINESRKALDNTARMIQKPLSVTDERQTPVLDDHKIAPPALNANQSLPNLVDVTDDPE